MDLIDRNSTEVSQFFSSLEELKSIIKQTLKERPPLFNGEKYLDGTEICKLLHISTRTLQDYRDRRVLGYVQISGKILYKESDVVRLLDENYCCAINIK